MELIRLLPLPPPPSHPTDQQLLRYRAGTFRGLIQPFMIQTDPSMPVVRQLCAMVGSPKGHHRTRQAHSGIRPGPPSKTWPHNSLTAAMAPRKRLHPALRIAREGHLPQPMIGSRVPHRLNGDRLARLGNHWEKGQRRIGLPMSKRRNVKACLRPTATYCQTPQDVSKEGARTNCIMAPLLQRKKRKTEMLWCTFIR